MSPEQLRPVEVEARHGYTLWVRFDDGVEGEIDLSPHAGQGVFNVWDDPGVFESVSFTTYQAIRWAEDAELCASGASRTCRPPWRYPCQTGTPRPRAPVRRSRTATNGETGGRRCSTC